MWPWDHLAFGYLLYSAMRWAGLWAAPDGVTLAALVLGTQLPDLIDKPLAWSLGVLPSGLSLGHSIVFVVTAAGVAVAVGTRLGRLDLSVAFTVGLASHLLGDVLFAVLLGSSSAYEFVLWPFVPAEPEPAAGLLATTMDFWTEFLGFLATPTGRAYLLGDVVVFMAVIGHWIRDGAPGTGVFRRTPGV